MINEYRDRIAALNGEVTVLERTVAEKQARIDELQDLVEWMKHQLSEQAWHWTEVVTGLNLQLKHERKRNAAPRPTLAEAKAEFETDYIAGNLWAGGQRS